MENPRRPAEGQPHWLGWVVLLGIMTAVAVRASSTIMGMGGDLAGYIEVGELVLRGEDIYATSTPATNTWPPLFALIVVPLAVLARHSLVLARVIWAMIILASLAGALSFCVRLVYGKPLSFRRRSGAVCVASAAVLLPTLFALRAILENFIWAQVNSLVLLVALAGCYLIARSRPVPGGVLIGLAAAIKVIPVFFVPYFIWKRWWRALGAMLAGGALLTLLPVVVFGFERWWSYASRFLGGSASGTFIGSNNQSLYAAFHQILVQRKWWNDEWVVLDRVDMEPRAMVAVLLVLLVSAGLFIFATRRGGSCPSSAAVATEFSIVLGASILFLPFTWKHYFIFLLPAYVILWRVAVAPAGAEQGHPYSLEHRQRRRIRWLLGAGVLLQVAVSSSILGRPISHALKHLSNQALGAGLILAALLYFRWILGRRSAADLPPLPGDPPQSRTSSVTTSQ